MANSYNEDFQKATLELSDLYAQQNALEVKIAKQQRRVAALKALVEDEEGELGPDPNLGGLTESIRSVLQAAFPMPLTMSEIKDRLTALHFPVHQYKNFRGSLHTVLKRFIDSNHVERTQVPTVSPAHDSGMRGAEQPPTQIAYQWATIIRRDLTQQLLRRRGGPPPPPDTNSKGLPKPPSEKKT